MDIILYDFFDGIRYLIIAGLVYLAWKFGNDNAKEENYKSALWTGFLLCVGIALCASYALGSPTCAEYEPLGGCIEYADYGYNVTKENRIGSFVQVLTVSYIPLVMGVLSKKSSNNLKNLY